MVIWQRRNSLRWDLAASELGVGSGIGFFPDGVDIVVEFYSNGFQGVIHFNVCFLINQVSAF